jgi:T4 superinfection immunity protein/zinc ribbon protein
MRRLRALPCRANFTVYLPVRGSDPAFGGDQMEMAIKVIMYLAIVGLAFIMYFLPWFVALRHHHRDAGLIALVNFLLGWTVVFWVACLIWATRPPAEVPKQAASLPSAGGRFCGSCGTKMAADSKFCPGCGAVQAIASSNPEPIR